MDLRDLGYSLIMDAIEKVKPEAAIRNSLALKENSLTVNELTFSLSDFEGIYVIGFGKAGSAMAQTVEHILGETLSGGMVITKYGHSLPTRKIQVVEAGHPVPDENSLRYTGELLDFIKNMPEKALVITLISGGGSALLESLPPSINLGHLQELTQALLASGADITELNTIRKHISRVKGGQLMRAIYPRTNISLIISDVIGDPLDFIASGPTVPDSTTFVDAMKIIEKYELKKKIPESILTYIFQGIEGVIPETPKSDDPVFEHSYNFIIANNTIALKELERQVREHGYHPIILSNCIEGEAREVGRIIAAICRSVTKSGYPVAPPAAVIFGGETTVTLTGNGKGGRNQELATSFLTHCTEIHSPFVFVACGTDGTDGPTDAAGGIICHRTLDKVKKSGLNPFEFLKRNDTYHFLQQIDALLKTGPTQTNVMDINLLLVGEPNGSFQA